MGTLRIPFDVDACRQWREMYPKPPKDMGVRDFVWTHFLADIEAACDEIELLRAERRLPS
jgi:hypothetical protein